MAGTRAVSGRVLLSRPSHPTPVLLVQSPSDTLKPHNLLVPGTPERYPAPAFGCGG
jgi:hypothetical protein